MPGLLRRQAAGVALGLLFQACAGGGGDGFGGEAARSAPPKVAEATCSDRSPVQVERTESSPEEGGASALLNPSDSDFPPPLVDPDDLLSGGPAPDGIPPIDEPKFVRQCSVDWLTTDEPVLALEIGADARAYPLRIMTWHELVNDTVGSAPVTVSYCPLCNTGIAYDRRAADRVLDFGTSGKLYNSALVMYDRQTQSLWSHFTAQSIAGALTGTKLKTIPVSTVGFADFRRAHPDGLVLSTDTGHDRDYGANPYEGYDDPAASPFLFDGEADPALPEMTRVVGVSNEDDPVALVSEKLLEERVFEFEAGGEPLVALAKPGTTSALERSRVDQGRDVGSTGVFVPVVDGRRLSFEATERGFTDAETGSGWDIFGRAVSGPLEGSQLERLQHVDTFWFAWSSFHPDTRVALK
ncbi:MAG: DUF3179 domain-containing protein [Actinobacteria bacterium]|nr:DUF3179 domain-containing protein [Actinomycetota bacterium]